MIIIVNNELVLYISTWIYPPNSAIKRKSRRPQTISFI